MTPSVAIVGDAKLALLDMNSALVRTIRSGENPRTQRTRDLQRARSEFEAIVDSECKNANEIPIMTKRVVRELNEVFGKDTILANENE